MPPSLLTLAGAVLRAVADGIRATADFDLQAHRGGRGETTEESLRAFAKALELGVSTLELDIVITKDGQPLVWHDPTIDAEKCADTGPAFAGDPQYPYVGKLVHELTLVQLRTLDCGKPTRRVSRRGSGAGQQDSDVAGGLRARRLVSGPNADVRYNIETKVEADQPGSVGRHHRNSST